MVNLLYIKFTLHNKEEVKVKRTIRLTAFVMIIMFAFSMLSFTGFADDTTADVSSTAQDNTKSDDKDTAQTGDTAKSDASSQIFADVDASTRYRDAIEQLYNKKIIDGYLDENGVRTFKPDATITRGEFSKLLAVAMPNVMTLDMNVKECGFSDVDSDPTVAWTIPYVKAAVNASIVNGYEDKTFRASNPVSYAEAIKMIVCAMGYANKVTATDPWYTGYITLADQLKVTLNAAGNGVYDAPASRGIVAQLISNMVTSDNVIPTLPSTNPGGNTGGGHFSFDDGSKKNDDKDETYGFMSAAFDLSVASGETGLSRTQVKIDGNVYEIGTYTIDQMKEFVGFNVDISYNIERNKNIITKITKGDYTEYKITADDFEEMDGLTLKYVENDGDKIKSLKFSTDSYLIYNGEPTGKLSQTEMIKLLTISDGYITVIDNDSNRTADVAYIYNYETYFVGAVDQSSFTVTDMYAKDSKGTKKSVVLDEDKNENITFKLLNSSGSYVAAAFGTITKNSVISVAKPYKEDDDEAKIEVIISKKTVKGSVTARGTDYATIDSKKYTLSNYYTKNGSEMTPSDISAGDTATFYLDYDNNIVAVYATDMKKYGYIANVEIEDGASADTAIIKMITTSNKKIASYTLKDTVTVNGERVKKKEVPALLKASADVINTGSGKEAAGLADNAYYAQPVIFETNSANSTIITSLKTVANGTESDASKALEYSLGKTDGAQKVRFKSNVFYKGTTNTALFKFTSSTSSDYKGNIFVVPTDRLDDEDEYQVYTTATSYFKNDNDYYAEAFNVEDSTKYGNIIVVYGSAPSKIDGYYKANLITDITSELDEEEEVVNVIHYIELSAAQTDKNPTSKTVIVKDKSLINSIKKGDIIKFATKNSAGKEITLIEKVFVGGELYTPFNGGDTQDVSSEYVINEKYNSDTDYFNAMVGRVYDKTETDVQLILGYDITDPNMDFASAAKMYNVSASGTHVIVVDRSKLSSNKNDAITYYKYQDVGLNSILANNLGSEDFVYAQRSGTGRLTGIVIYK